MLPVFAYQAVKTFASGSGTGKNSGICELYRFYCKI